MKSDFIRGLTLIIMAFGLSHAGLTFSAEETTAEQTTAEETKDGGDESDVPQGILPIPGYGDDIANRSYLTGDWDGMSGHAMLNQHHVVAPLSGSP